MSITEFQIIKWITQCGKLWKLSTRVPKMSNNQRLIHALNNMTKEWQPKVTSIKDSENLNTIGITILFGKLKEHEHEIARLKVSEDI
uniref:Uncharacterized protein n=1 Tax=Medicago truncatula TaxID=3880 RepID=Q2HRP2_MEDTR|nr:hypothetical protein MtrDRAFT_AC158464g15v2 [Medicago truncatula]